MGLALAGAPPAQPASPAFDLLTHHVALVAPRALRYRLSAMSTVAGRKKSIISAGGVSIDQPVANNSALNKSATVSLYQKCSALRTDLLRIRNFRQYFAIASAHASSRQSTDPVTQLWDCLALGVPLCFLYNLLPPPYTPIKVDTRPEAIDVDDLKPRKRAIALFIMQMKRTAPEAEEFTVTDLSGDRLSTDGFVKVRPAS